MNIDTNLLLYFVAVGEELSFRKAADRLNIAQPWLSRQIRKLEEQLGFDLFVRTTRHVEVTERGARLLERARILAREVAATRTLAKSLTREHPDKLRLGVPFYGLYVNERIALFDTFTDRHPTIKLDIRTGLSAQLQTDLLNGEIDASFSAGSIDESALDILMICVGGVEIMMHDSDALAAKDELSPGDLDGCVASVFPRPSNPGLYDQLFSAFQGRASRFVEYSNISFTRRLEELGSLTAVPSWSPILGTGSVRRRLPACGEAIKFQLLRRRGVQAKSLDLFWQTARDLFART
ncbi:MAG TPA: LysR family transcriptional regulator [Rhizomicrobium sp.]|nr:LysR family transcriptional regulator [Rhizomicrobium sp.]